MHQPTRTTLQRLRPLIYPAIGGLCLWSHLIAARPLAETIDAQISQQLPQATVGVLIKDIETGRTIYSSNADKLLCPASGMKLFTAAAALYQLGPHYHFITGLAQKDQDYYLSFSGSPSLTIKNLQDLLENLPTNGVKIITGNILLDIARYRSPYYAAGLSHDDLGWYYAAPDSAVILNKNAQTYTFITGEKPGAAVTIRPQIAGIGPTIRNDLRTVSTDEAKDHCAMHIALQAKNTLHVFGCLAPSPEPQIMRLAVPDPIAWLKELIQKNLADRGIVFHGQIITGHIPPDATPLARLQSNPLQTLVRHMLKTSDNVYANSLTKLLGYVITGEGSYEQGIYAIKKILSQHSTLDMRELGLADGMGTRYNLATAQQMVTLLSDLYHNNKMQSLILDALPQAGVSGTLRFRMQKTALEKNTFAKTGTMHDMSSLSGYMINPNGRTLVFSIIINGVNRPIAEAKALEEQILSLANAHFLQT